LVLIRPCLLNFIIFPTISRMKGWKIVKLYVRKLIAIRRRCANGEGVTKGTAL